MKIVVDADACPVKEIIVTLAKTYEVELIMVCDTSHELHLSYGTAITVDKQSDSADFAIVNLLKAGDIAVTQDYGLASMVLAKKAFCINQNGMEYTSENIDKLLFERHLNKKARQAGIRSGHIKKRTKENDAMFEAGLKKLLEKTKSCG